MSCNCAAKGEQAHGLGRVFRTYRTKYGYYGNGEVVDPLPDLAGGPAEGKIRIFGRPHLLLPSKGGYDQDSNGDLQICTEQASHLAEVARAILSDLHQSAASEGAAWSGRTNERRGPGVDRVLIGRCETRQRFIGVDFDQSDVYTWAWRQGLATTAVTSVGGGEAEHFRPNKIVFLGVQIVTEELDPTIRDNTLGSADQDDEDKKENTGRDEEEEETKNSDWRSYAGLDVVKWSTERLLDLSRKSSPSPQARAVAYYLAVRTARRDASANVQGVLFSPRPSDDLLDSMEGYDV